MRFSLTIATNNPKRKAACLKRKKAENLRQRKETLLKKVYKLGRDFSVDVALILRHNRQFITYRSIDIESWLLSIKEIVRTLFLYT